MMSIEKIRKRHERDTRLRKKRPLNIRWPCRSSAWYPEDEMNYQERDELLRVIDAVEAIGPVHKSWNEDDDFCRGWDKCMEQVRAILRGEGGDE